MGKTVVSSLEKALGARGAAHQLLTLHPKKLPRAGEAFFIARWAELKPGVVVDWLWRETHEDLARPTHAIAAGLLEYLAAGRQHVHSAEWLRQQLSMIPDPFMRDELVDGLRTRIPHETWLPLIVCADGCETFTQVVRVCVTDGALPCSWIEREALSALAVELFDCRRDETECRARLRLRAEAPETSDCALWLAKEISELREIATAEALRLEDLPSVFESEEGWEKRKFRLGIAADLVEVPSICDAVVRRAIDAAERGVPWGYLWWELPAVLRDRAAIASVGTSFQAPWACAALQRTFEGNSLVDKLVTLLSQCRMRENDVEHLHNAAIRCGANEQDFEQAREEFWSAWRTRDVFVRTPLSDDVDEQLADRVENAHLHSLPEDKRALVAHRIARLPLTASRARRLVDLCLGSGFFYKLDRCVEIARVVAPLGADIPRPLPSDSRGLAAYEILVGEHALGQWFDQALAQNNFWDALELITHADSLRTSANEAALKDKVPFEELGPLVSLQRKHPWLLTEDQVTAAVETDRYPDEQWLRTGPLARYLWPAARRKAETTKNTRLAVWLIDRLCGRDSELDRALLGTAITRVEQSGTEAMEAHVVGRLLHSGKRWEQEGIRLVSWSVANASSKAALWLDRVLDRSVAAAKQIDSKAKRRPSEASVMKTVHSLFAGTLAHAARTSVEAGNVERAHRLLRALTHVSTPPRVMSRIMSLRSLAGVEPLLDLIEANEGLAREAGTSYEASHVMSALLTVAGLMPADEMGEDDEARDTLRAQ